MTNGSGVILEPITKTRGHELAKTIKNWYVNEGGNTQVSNTIYYDVIADKYHVMKTEGTYNQDLHSRIAIGQLMWQEVMLFTGRNSLKAGGIYIYDWVNAKVEEFNKHVQERQTQVDHNNQNRSEDEGVGNPCRNHTII